MEKVRFKSPRDYSEDVELVGNYWSADSDAGIVMSHGFTGDKREWGYFDLVAEKLNDSGYNVLAFDFGGCGESNDEPIRIDNEVRDLSSAIDYLMDNGIDRVGLYGHSQGGLISLKIHSYDIESIFLTSPVTDNLANYADYSLTEEQREELKQKGHYTKNRDKGVRNEFIVDEEIIEVKESLNQYKILSEVKCPVMIIHGTEDDIVPIASSRRAADMLENGDLKEIDGLTHSYERRREVIAKYASEFFLENLPIQKT